MIGLLGLTGCDKLLEVDLPAAITSDALDDPSVAPVLVSSVIGNVECAYTAFGIDAAGMEDNFQKVSGSAGNYSEYPTPGAGDCDGTAITQSWIDGMLTARGDGYSTWNSIQGWTVADKPELLAQTALYTAIALDVFGEHMCEFAIDGGPLLTPNQTLAIAEGWIDSAMTQISAAGGTFPLEFDAGTATDDIEMMAYGVLARIQWAQGNLSQAAASAAMVDSGYVAWATRGVADGRRNKISAVQGLGGAEAAGFVQGQISTTPKTSSAPNAMTYSIDFITPHPVTTAYGSAAWPDPIPFTGYIDLGIVTATGRAVDANGNPILTSDAGTEADVRVDIVEAQTAAGIDHVPAKHPTLSTPYPIVNWYEARLIQAENAGATQTGIDFINEIRVDAGLPIIQGAYATALIGDDDQYENMLLEERRRALWLEGRFFAAKILHNDKLWFPRGQGAWVNDAATYALGGSVRYLMPTAEYEINENFTLDDRGTGCDADPGQVPVF